MSQFFRTCAEWAVYGVSAYLLWLALQFPKRRVPLVPIPVPDGIKQHPNEEVFFAKSAAEKIDADGSAHLGEIILSNHRVIFKNGEAFHEYRMSDLKHADAKDGLKLFFSGNTRAHFRVADGVNAVFDRLRKSDH